MAAPVDPSDALRRTPMASVHARHRAALERLRHRDALAGELARIGAARGLWPEDGGTWRCRVARLEVPEHPQVRLVLESDGDRQRLADATIPLRELEEAGLDLPTLAARGALRLRAFPDDPALPTLGAVVRTATGARVVRYRPGRRCTLHVARAPGGERYVKVFPSAEEGRGVARAQALVHSAVRSEGTPFRVAAPLGWEEAQLAFTQEALPGRPIVGELLGPSGPALARKIGEATGCIGALPLAGPPVLDARAQLVRSARYVESLVALVPALGPAAWALFRRLEHLHAGAPTAEPRPLHGSPHAHQWLLADGDLGLVDFDRLSLGEPELDAATFLAEMDYEDASRVPVAEIRAAFLAGFEARGGALHPVRLAAYRAHKHLSKALKAARSVRPDGDARAARNLARAAALLRS